MTELPDLTLYKIIVVDSDNLFCHQLQTCLKDAGFQVECERNAQVGLKRIKQWKPHIVVSDFILHGLDYLDFASKVEALSKRARMVVVSSQYLDTKLLAQLRTVSSVSLTVQKPIKPGDLLERILEFIPDIDTAEESEFPSPEIDPDYNLGDVDLQQEVARLQFEGKELPRLVNSLKALTTMAREQPHKSKYLREALEQSKRSFEEVRRQRLAHLEAPFERLTNWISDIIDQGSLPRLEQWDYVERELEQLSEPSKRIGTAIMPDFDTQEQFPYSLETHEQLPLPKEPVGWSQPPEPVGWSQSPKPTKSSLVRPVSRLQKFLIIGHDPTEQLLNLASRYEVSLTFKDGLEEAIEFCLAAEPFDLILLLLPSTLSGERARETVIAAHETFRAIDTYSEIPLAILSATESLHTRIVTAHLHNAHWISWSELRKSDSEFLKLKVLANQPVMRPAILILDSDISDSEELLRELTRSCGRVDAVADPNQAIKAIEENRPDIVLINQHIGDLSGFDLCRALTSCLSFRGITIVLEVDTINDSALKGAFRAGVDGIVCKTETVESRAESVLTIFRRNLTSRLFSDDRVEKSLEVPRAIKEALETDLKKAVEEQLPLAICLIDLSEGILTCEEFSRLWNSKQKEIGTNTPKTSSLHFLDSKQILVSIVGMRKSSVARILDEMVTEQQQEEEDTAYAWRFKCRCYPDDALSLSDLLIF